MCLGAVMNFIEAIDLLKVVSSFDFEEAVRVKKFSIYDGQNDGFAVCVKAESVDEDFHDFLGEVVEFRGLRLSESNGYLLIHS